MRVAREKIFGPVLCVPSCRDEKEAISIANDTHYGPQANVFSSDLEPAQRANDRIEAGRVIINGAPHEPLAPFGASSNQASAANSASSASKPSSSPGSPFLTDRSIILK
ncbi:acyl-CoA reductase-like NAD-dependent aldehyde dehydrogenase [Sinorhizobium meliloti]